MSEITIAGESFNVRLEGDESKPIVALAHQLGGSLAVWEPLMPALLEHFRVLRWDLRGHGASVANEGPYSIAQLARDAIAIFDALGIEKAHWLGLSMGAIVGQAALIAAPDRIGRAALANTAAKLGTPDIWNARIRAALEDGMEAMAGTVAARWFTPEFREAEPDRPGDPLHPARNAASRLRRRERRFARRRPARSDQVHSQQGPRDRRPLDPRAAGTRRLRRPRHRGARPVRLELSHISPIEQAEAFARAAIDFLIAPEAPARRPPAPANCRNTGAATARSARSVESALKEAGGEEGAAQDQCEEPQPEESAGKANVKQGEGGGPRGSQEGRGQGGRRQKARRGEIAAQGREIEAGPGQKAAAKGAAKTAKKAAAKSKAANKPRRR